MFDWLKERKKALIASIILFFVLLLGVPFIINLLFKFSSNIYVFQAEWSAGDALAYFGSVLSFVGTVILGALALYQNYIIQIDADKKAKRLEFQEHAENMPRFFLRFTSASGYCGKLGVTIMNVSDNIAYDINIYDVKLERGSNAIWRDEDTYASPVINPHGEIVIKTQTPSQNGHEEVVFFATMSCLDKYNERHEYSLRMVCRYPNKYQEASIIEIEH